MVKQSYLSGQYKNKNVLIDKYDTATQIGFVNRKILMGIFPEIANHDIYYKIRYQGG